MKEETKAIATSSAITVVAGAGAMLILQHLGPALVDNVGWVTVTLTALAAAVLIIYVKHNEGKE